MSLHHPSIQIGISIQRFRCGFHHEPEYTSHRMMMVWIAGRDLYDFAPSLTKAVALRRERENSKAVQGILLPRLAEYGADPSRMRVLLTWSAFTAVRFMRHTPQKIGSREVLIT
jgi:hypothetical protein